jgi:hypothetical protein
LRIPQLQITQTYGQISIRQDHGGVEIQQPRAKMDVTTERPRIEIERVKGKLEIDQSKAWEAYGIMSPIEVTSRIYSEVRNIALQAIAKKAQEGDRMAAIHKSTNVIPELAAEKSIEFLEMEYFGEASYDNVDVSYTPDQLSFRPINGEVNIQVEPQKPLIERVPAKVTIGMERYPSIQITVAGQHINQLL